MVPGVAVKILLTPLLLGAATLAGRRWGHHISGWLVALPLTSAPVAWFLAMDRGLGFAARAAVGMLAGTASQITFALAYRGVAGRGWRPALAAGATGFALTTLALSRLSLRVPAVTAVVVVAWVAGILVMRRSSRSLSQRPPVTVAPPRWDLPVRMAVATALVLAITALAPLIGAQLAGLVSPFPVFGAVTAVLTQSGSGPAAGIAALDGLVLGLAAPAAFFFVLALTLQPIGLPGFAVASAAALITQTATVTALPAASAARAPTEPVGAAGMAAARSGR